MRSPAGAAADPAARTQNCSDEATAGVSLQRLPHRRLGLGHRAAGALTSCSLPSGASQQPDNQHLQSPKNTPTSGATRPVLLPPRLADLLRRLAEQPQPRAIAQPGPQTMWTDAFCPPALVPAGRSRRNAMPQKLNRHASPSAGRAAHGALSALATD